MEVRENIWYERQEARVVNAKLTWEEMPRAFDGHFMRRYYEEDKGQK